jgi:hypothetical protein
MDSRIGLNLWTSHVDLQKRQPRASFEPKTATSSDQSLDPPSGFPIDRHTRTARQIATGQLKSPRELK